MTHIEALKLARDCIRDSIEYKQGKATAIEAVEDIEEALAQPQQKPTDTLLHALDYAIVHGWPVSSLTRLAAIRDTDKSRHQKQAQPQQEPVAWLYKSDEPSFDGNKWHDTFEMTTIKQVAFWKDKDAKPLYTAPPQRTWVGLRDDEKSLLWEISRAALPRYATYANLVEAKLKEKNT